MTPETQNRLIIALDRCLHLRRAWLDAEIRAGAAQRTAATARAEYEAAVTALDHLHRDLKRHPESERRSPEPAAGTEQ